ncbi:hypothetical protein SAMN04488007_2840 [Maribacter aquivivus]|uniref:DUF7668 domain-containing protein n=1 Tax=Maribacter aquivivus TaxID=228958 RepID=A0A1M6RTK7_9FLAO|nr:hypothetical protein [Maribacter aquivivus]SHK35763.1 hypothetical protein SAMN04488007_2840 [Maribacter aquivivus]
MIDNDMHQLAYNLNNELLDYINHRNLNKLNSNYGITSAMFEEIEEVINDVGVDLKKVGLKIKGGKLLDIWEFDELNGYGVEVDLITINGERTDLTLITELDKVGEGYKLEYRQLGVM